MWFGSEMSSHDRKERTTRSPKKRGLRLPVGCKRWQWCKRWQKRGLDWVGLGGVFVLFWGQNSEDVWCIIHCRVEDVKICFIQKEEVWYLVKQKRKGWKTALVYRICFRSFSRRKHQTIKTQKHVSSKFLLFYLLVRFSRFGMSS